MQLSQFLAQLFGVLYIVVGIGFLVEKKHYKMVLADFSKSPALMYYGGAIALMIGFCVTYLHNYWGSDWAVLVTLIGWVAFIKGIVILIAPRLMLDFVKWWGNKIEWAASAALGLGLVLVYFGFLV
ncbi:hypothetical protein COU77_03920 [Candidatus Peregrinibacteria bacterium CG10_big_fil_rev_8_21_14_0_10_49_16]|nr:MAG: hypothetical protein COW95_04015 [Candidatus Peregrinibacteria bacterium CG22_combo_CG10-13_8_21_14_all_49_11]PIR51761.1 MAG: hypothetical protein COU77_03920 [Candidatus Peregrinibacteria bacterium CG10_big_fil_rev_8_21_14_0_10_49_16]